MPMYKSNIDPSLSTEKLQTQPESQFFDRKSGRIAPHDLAHHLSAFANASGGVIAIGIEDDGSITGVSPAQENALRQAAMDFLAAPPQMKIEMVASENPSKDPCSIMLFHISPCSDSIIKLKNGEVYLRVGDSSRKLTPEQYLSLEYSRGTKSFESTIVEGATLEDLDADLLSQYLEICGAAASSRLDILKARGLIKEKEGKTQITVAAILLFGKIPTQFLPCARVRFLKYEGINVGVGANFNVVKDITVEKPLHVLLSEMQQLLKSQMREFQRLDRDGKFVKVPEYPDFAWLEGLVNAVAHRDYSIAGDYIRISMFDDRIQFLSPGKLPSIVTVENIKTTRFSRNPIIARVLSDFGWVRELNEGVKRIYVDMENLFLDPPEFSEPNGNTVSLILKNNIAVRSLRTAETSVAALLDIWGTLSALDREIIYYIANLSHCTTKDLDEIISKSRPTIVTHLKKLVEVGAIVEHSSSLRDPTKYYTIRTK